MGGAEDTGVSADAVAAEGPCVFVVNGAANDTASPGSKFGRCDDHVEVRQTEAKEVCGGGRDAEGAADFSFDEFVEGKGGGTGQGFTEQQVAEVGVDGVEAIGGQQAVAGRASGHSGGC